MAGPLLFDEISKNSVQAVFPILPVPKPPSKHTMYGSHILRRSVCQEKRRQLAHIQDDLRMINLEAPLNSAA
jgi:hypothetical protein